MSKHAAMLPTSIFYLLIFCDRIDHASSGRLVLPMMLIIPSLLPIERQFVEKLDRELNKVENFYVARESDARNRGVALKKQLRELQDHRKNYKV